MSYLEVMSVPIRAFWLMNFNIDRVQAQGDIRALTVAISGQDGEAAQDYRQKLVLEVGTIVKLEEGSVLSEKRDEEGFSELREMAKQM
jgi:hypothetical protein